MQVNNIHAGKTKPERYRPFANLKTIENSTESLSDELRKGFHAIPAGILFINRNGVVELANKAARELFKQNIEGNLWRSVISQFFDPRKDDGLEVSLTTGHKVKFSISKIPDVPGQLIHLTDLTQTRALQTKISHMQRLSSLGKMMASLAHQLRTPLSAALLYARNLQTTGLPVNTQLRFSEKLITRLKDLEKQINDMLLFAKSGNDQIIESIDLDGLVARLVEEASETQTQNAQFSFVPAKENCQIQGNRTAISGALSNLLQNAISVGATHIQVAVVSGVKSVDVLVTDNGPGIAKDALHKIFEPFYTSRQQGTGLGLSVVRAVMHSHKGTVNAVNNADTGARFTLSFPVSQSSRANTNAKHQANDLSKFPQSEGELA